jgi:hypothetical protein
MVVPQNWINETLLLLFLLLLESNMKSFLMKTRIFFWSLFLTTTFSVLHFNSSGQEINPKIQNILILPIRSD